VKKILPILLPKPADNTIRGSKIPFYFFIVTAAILTVRSCIHIFVADGGTGSIAGMDLNVTGANEVIFAFALWDSEQLIYSLIQWIVIIRYRSLIPVMWVIQLLEITGRMVVGHLKPVIFLHTPPGRYGNYVYLIVSVCMIFLSVNSGIKVMKNK
jgi:hypothetical protein